MKQIKADGSSGPVDMGTLLDQPGVQRAADAATRIGQLITPNAQDIWIKDLHTYPDGRIEITDFRAQFADGTVVRAPSIVIEPA
ncbi:MULTISPECIES: hypothetical protein [unclassified Mycobacterium]|uniref:hypothetical protein n=1 Tax=unclassified Mycobacterium TaxID=2642494 RepID=UPI0008006903|nr:MULTISPECIES: hypothetical protein [unclassified Mycobacterium]OBG75339.1 hypothetical protein A5700_01840 [Mycobacterium sp. E1214]OBH31599.1 hypothetical protein A5693_15895 [Mycobacterium sp. E1319]